MHVMPLTWCLLILTQPLYRKDRDCAIPAEPLGGPFGVQLSALFQWPEIGSRCPCDLIAHVPVGISSSEQRIAANINISTVISESTVDAIDYCRSKLAIGKAH